MNPSVAAELVVRLDAGQCVGCAICADVCQPAALKMGPEDLLPRWLPARCTFCAECERQCPTAAIHLEPA